MKDNITILDVISIIEKRLERSVSQSEFAKVIGTSTPSLNARISKKGGLKLSEILAAENHYKCGLLFAIELMVFGKNANFPDAVEIIYYENPKLTNIIKNPDITSLWLDRELIYYKWKKSEQDLRIIQMPGDSMDGGASPISNKDILIIDISDKNPVASGIFAYTTQNDTLIFVNDIKQKADGSLKFNFWNERYKESVYTISDLKTMNFNVIGRVIKNMSID